MVRFGRDQDREAFEEVVRRWDRPVLGFLAKSIGDLEVAEDLRQEVFIRIYRYGAGYDPRYAFPTWLFRIASNVIKTWRTKQGRRREVPLFEDEESPGYAVAEGAPDARQRLASDQSDDRVRAHIARLEPDERELLLLRFDQSLSYREIGEVKGEPETTVKSRIYKLLGRLRREISCSELSERMP